MLDGSEFRLRVRIIARISNIDFNLLFQNERQLQKQLPFVLGSGCRSRLKFALTFLFIPGNRLELPQTAHRGYNNCERRCRYVFHATDPHAFSDADYGTESHCLRSGAVVQPAPETSEPPGQVQETPEPVPVPPSESSDPELEVTEGTETYRGFQMDNVLHAPEGEIHYHIYIPDSYDGREPYALFLTLPGYEGLYFQGVGQNLYSENFAFEALNYNDRMIVAAPQLSDWGETSAVQAIALTEYLLDHYNIDRERVYAEGYSGGGETMSRVMGMRPDLFTAYLQCSSQWDGAYEPVVEARVPVYFVIGEGDEYYSAEPSREAYSRLHDLYTEAGMTEEEIGRLLVLDIKDADYFRAGGALSQHGGGNLFAGDPEIMGWLFGQ